MSRLLALVLLLLVFVLAARRVVLAFLSSPFGRQLGTLWHLLGVGPRRPPPGSAPAAPPHELVRCSGCGTYVPRERCRSLAGIGPRCESCRGQGGAPT